MICDYNDDIWEKMKDSLKVSYVFKKNAHLDSVWKLVFIDKKLFSFGDDYMVK